MDKTCLQVILSKGACFEGELKFKGTARIAGKFKGQIKGIGRLIIESSAQVEADMELDHLVLFGQFSGKAKTNKSTLMEPPARFYGEISSPVLSIKEGVFFEGSSKKISKKDL